MFLSLKFLGLGFGQCGAVGEVQGVAECLVHARNGGIGVSVRPEQAALAFDEGVQHVPFIIRVGDELRTAQQQRVVGDEQPRAVFYGFVSGGGEGINGEVHVPHGGGGAPADQPGCVPPGGQLRRVEVVEGGNNLR